MEKALFAVIHDSGLDRLFKPGRVRREGSRQPFYVTVRLKLNNPYTFLGFEAVMKKNGLKFNIHHTKRIHPELRKALILLGGSPNNGNTGIEFPFDADMTRKALEIYRILLVPEMIELCGASGYKPLRLILEDRA
ncbi:MAG: hypothetical protein LBR47_05300 [Spirochaetaceae bacterium]|nr:hypothetical protein [Spirochaetaceae bacterium]